jgi:mono/diheme cytochrome c family protein
MAKAFRVLGLMVFLQWPAMAASGESPEVTAGRVIAETYCAVCHAIGPSGESPRQGAPKFRELARRFPVENLEEALAEGITTGHPDMPEFEMTPEEIGVFLVYLKSIQNTP